jgi:RNA ligase (TIGR02306 family)
MKLAEIQTINEIIPIEGADKIELARVQGWQSVIRRGEYSVGDKVVFVPIDTVLPPSVWNSYLHDKEDPTKPIRVKTVKLRGTISSGLIFPLSILDPFTDYDIGQDISSILGITKYVKPIAAHLQGIAKGDFPSHIVSKTDEDNLLSNPDILNELKSCDTIVCTIKYDGTSGSFIKELDGTFRACSRNLELEDGDNIYWQMAKKYNLENLMDNGMSIQGEICGSIQGNPLKLEENQLFVFNIKDLKDGSYLSYDDMCMTLENTGLNVVKEVSRIFGEDINNISIDYFQRLSNEQKYGSSPAEGIVIRGFKNGNPVFSSSLQKMLSVKVINQDYKD